MLKYTDMVIFTKPFIFADSFEHRIPFLIEYDTIFQQKDLVRDRISSTMTFPKINHLLCILEHIWVH